MPLILAIFGIFTLVAGRKQWDEFQSAVEGQIKEGKDAIRIGLEAVMNIIDNDPDMARAQEVLDQAYNELPDKFQKEWDSVIGDLESGNELTLGKLDALGVQFDRRMATIAGEYRGMETEVLGLLADQGVQAREDIAKAFDESSAMAQTELSSRGLAGSGVGASIAAGFTEREADAIARQREEESLVRAGALTDLRSQRLGFEAGASGAKLEFGARAAEIGAGFGRDVAEMRAGGLETAYGLRSDAGTALSGFYAGRAGARANVRDTATQRKLDLIQNIEHVPPPSQDVFMSQLGPYFGSKFG